MTTDDTSAAAGNDAVGGGPQAFGSLRRHQSVEPAIQTTDDTDVAANARCFQPGTAEVASAIAKSIGKYAGKVDST